MEQARKKRSDAGIARKPITSNARFSLRLTAADKSQLNANARAAGKTATDYVILRCAQPPELDRGHLLCAAASDAIAFLPPEQADKLRRAISLYNL